MILRLSIQSIERVKSGEYVKEIERYNGYTRENPDLGENLFFTDTVKHYPEFEAIYEKSQEKKPKQKVDLIQFLMEESEFLNKDENSWMKTILQVVRKTSLFFQPQIRTKIMNEGWASYWHEKLFLQDKRIKGHEVDFAKVHAAVTSLSRVGVNPYALGMRLFQFIEETADKGKYSFEFHRQKDAHLRDRYDLKTGKGQDYIFEVRENFCDFLFINNFVDQNFINQNKLFVVGRRPNQTGTSWEYYVKSRKGSDYRNMLKESLFHPPQIEIRLEKGATGALYLDHRFEGKPLMKEFISNTMIGIEYLWGGPVRLETNEVVASDRKQSDTNVISKNEEGKSPEVKWRKILYSIENRKLSVKPI